MLPGIIGIIIPILPGIPYMFLVSLIYGFASKFHTLSYKELMVLGIIGVTSFIVDYSTGLIGAKYGGASKRSIALELLGSIVGTIVMPPFGGIVGLFAAILLSEIFLHNDHKKALKAASGSLFGSLIGIIINLILAIVFLILFLIFSLG